MSGTWREEPVDSAAERIKDRKASKIVLRTAATSRESTNQQCAVSALEFLADPTDWKRDLNGLDPSKKGKASSVWVREDHVFALALILRRTISYFCL